MATELEIAMAKRYLPMNVETFLQTVAVEEPSLYGSDVAAQYLGLLAIDGNDRRYTSVPLLANNEKHIGLLRRKAHECMLISEDGRMSDANMSVCKGLLENNPEYKLGFGSVQESLATSIRKHEDRNGLSL